MSQEAKKIVGLGSKASPAASQGGDLSSSERAEETQGKGLLGLGATKPTASGGAASGGGLVGLGASKPAAGGAASGGGLVGLGASKPAASGGAASGGGLVGLGASKPAASGGAASGGGLVGLGASKPAASGGASGGGVVGLGGSKTGGAVVGLGSSGSNGSAPAAAAAAPVPRKSGISINVSAAKRINKLLSDRGTPAAGLRIRVRGGGCTGLTYDMEFADEARERDRVFEEHDVRIFVDPKSYIFLIGTELSYSAGLLESGFKLENPNAKKSCGCGDSFSV